MPGIQYGPNEDNQGLTPEPRPLPTGPVKEGNLIQIPRTPIPITNTIYRGAESPIR